MRAVTDTSVVGVDVLDGNPQKLVGSLSGNPYDGTPQKLVGSLSGNPYDDPSLERADRLT